MKTMHIKNNSNRFVHALLVVGIGVWALGIGPGACSAATVTGALQDISVQALNTKLVFTPTNEVLLTDSGLSAGPGKVVQTSSGSFNVALEAGDYTVSLPLIPWRRPFVISVMRTNGTVNITNLLANPRTYTYTNNLNYTLKATASDGVPDFLDGKLSVAGALSKRLVTNSGAVSIVLSNTAPARPAHANTFAGPQTARRRCWMERRQFRQARCARGVS
jgi:hypothetical protein